MEHFLLIEMTRDKYVERCKQRAFDHLDRADLRNSVASFVRNMNALPDCELPNYLAMLGGSLLTANDALGRRTPIEGLRRWSDDQASEGLGPLNFLGRGWRTTELTFWITTATL